MIRGNKPIGIGYPLLFINLADFKNRWSLPFEVEIVGTETDYVSLAAEKMIERGWTRRIQRFTECEHGGFEFWVSEIFITDEQSQEFGEHHAPSTRAQSVFCGA